MKKGFITAAVVLSLLGAALFAAAFFASGFDFTKLDTGTYETNSYTVSETFEAIEIRSDEAEIAFKPSGDGKLRVDCVEREKVRHTVTAENGVLKVAVLDTRAWYDRLTFFSFKPQSITVWLPGERYKALTVDSATGDVSVPDCFSFGEAEITASTGDVSFEASLEGSLKIKTSTGAIRLDGVRAEEIDLSVSTGRIEGKNVDCVKTFSFTVSTGKAVLTGVTASSMTSSGSTGGVRLENAVISGKLHLERDTGDVRFSNCDAGEITVRTSTGDVTGTLRSGKNFVVKTSTGDISVPESTAGGRCEITSSTGDIRISVAE